MSRSVRNWVLRVSILLVLSACGQNANDARAPIVLPGEFGGCELSPGGGFLEARGASDPQLNGIYAVATWTKADEPMAPARLQNQVVEGRVWLYPEVFLVYTAVAPHSPVMVDIPSDGWLVDMTHRIVTDVADLDPAAQAQILQLAADQIRTYGDRGAQDTSPDGRFVGSAGGILENNGWPTSGQPRTMVAEFKGARGTGSCAFGWKPDSSGIYFIELQGFTGRSPGPIRFLPVVPPP